MNAHRYGRAGTGAPDDYAGSARATAQPAYEAPAAGRRRSGSLAAAAVLLILGGLLSFLTGLAIVAKKAYFTSQPGYSGAANSYAYHWNITAWGWSSLVLGVIIVVAGVFVLRRETWARWLGVVLAVISAGGTFMFLPFYPYWSIIVIALDVFIIWALAAARPPHRGT